MAGREGVDEQDRRCNQAEHGAIARDAEERERDGAANDGDDALGCAQQQRESDEQPEVASRQEEQQQGRRHDADGDARDRHRLEVAAEEYLDEPAGELTMALERGDPDRRCAGEARRLQQRHELQRDDAENEAVDRHDEREKDDADNAHAPLEHGTVR